MKVGKKGVLSAAFLVGVILTIGGFLVVTPILLNIIGDDDKKAEAMCRKSVELRAATALRVESTEFKVFPVACKTLDPEISGSKEEIMGQVADKLARCWWMFGEGSYDELLDTDVLRKVFGFDKTVNECFMCYSLTIKGDEFEGKITRNELLEYMYTKKHSIYNEITYLDYIQNFNFGGPGMLGLSVGEIETGKMYGISFLAKNRKADSWARENLLICPLFAGPACAFPLAAAYGEEASVSGITDKIEDIYAERQVSGVFLDTLENTQRNCYKGDLAGN